MKNLTAKDPWALHQLRNALLLLISIIFLPFSAGITFLAIVLEYAGAIRPHRRIMPVEHGNKRAPRILVTGVGMTKGLFLARTMYLGGCDVLGADFEKSNGNFYCGRYSRSLQKFIALKNPTTKGEEAYVSQVSQIINDEQIDLWISCSGVATAIEDAKLARAIENQTKCKAFQFDEDLTSMLDDKLKFMQKTTDLQLASLLWYPLHSQSGIPQVLQAMANSSEGPAGKSTKFMIKCASMDDSSRGSLPLLDSRDLEEAGKHLLELDFENGRQWIVQEFIDSGEEYCTHAVIVNGKVRAFTACRSASVLLHYKQMDARSILYNKMLKFTQDYATGLGEKITGHLSFDFLVKYREAANGFEALLVPIECNPRVHTAVVLFEGREVELADIYLEALRVTQTARKTLKPSISSEKGFYWMCHDVVLGLYSASNLLFAEVQSNRANTLQELLQYLYHLCAWRDPTFLWWDPLPWFVLIHMYWPWELLQASYHGRKWKQLNVSTTKMFQL